MRNALVLVIEGRFAEHDLGAGRGLAVHLDEGEDLDAPIGGKPHLLQQVCMKGHLA